MSSRPNPCLFIVGCPRSGTTLLQRMLDHHPQLAVANDTHFIPQIVEDLGQGANPPVTPELLENLRSNRRFLRLKLPEPAVAEAAAQTRSYAQLVTALYSEFGARQGKPLAGEKTPDYVRRLPLLHALFPESRFLHIIRDGRDVALSTLEWAREDKGPGRFELWQEEPMAVCALWWRWLVSTGQRDGGSLGGTYREVCYDELVARPEQTLRDIAGFLDLADAPEMLAYHQGKSRDNPRLSAKSAWLPPTPGLRDWRTQMAARDAELFEAIAGDLLGSLGYERRVPKISPEIAAVAERCRQWWAAERHRRSGARSAGRWSEEHVSL